MKTTKREVRDTLKKAEESLDQLGEADKDPKVWFKKTETFAKEKKKDRALRSLCMATYLLFANDMNDPSAREDIICQTAHQFHAYGKKPFPSRSQYPKKSQRHYRRRRSVKK